MCSAAAGHLENGIQKIGSGENNREEIGHGFRHSAYRVLSGFIGALRLRLGNSTNIIDHGIFLLLAQGSGLATSPPERQRGSRMRAFFYGAFGSPLLRIA